MTVNHVVNLLTTGYGKDTLTCHPSFILKSGEVSPLSLQSWASLVLYLSKGNVTISSVLSLMHLEY